MSLTAEKELALRDAGLINFFDDNQEAFAEIAQAAYAYTENHVTSPVGLPLRRDDVAEIIVAALTTNEPLREYLADNSLRQKYWYRHFADLILDRLWEDLEDDPEEEDGD
ncbi:MAG TPA: hypothetical protein VG318_18645 [Actinomycetota bacterium]|nr:hypothetical protein [Actinomycetota bacterium]